MNNVVLLLGSNLGNKKNNITLALNLINIKIGPILKKTKLIESEPEDYFSSNNYLNIGIIVSTELSPIKLLKLVKEIERSLGRINDSYLSGKYEDRTIDIDIVYFNSIKYFSKILVIPHASHISKRSFSKKILYELV